VKSAQFCLIKCVLFAFAGRCRHQCVFHLHFCDQFLSENIAWTACRDTSKSHIVLQFKWHLSNINITRTIHHRSQFYCVHSPTGLIQSLFGKLLSYFYLHSSYFPSQTNSLPTFPHWPVFTQVYYAHSIATLDFRSCLFFHYIIYNRTHNRDSGKSISENVCVKHINRFHAWSWWSNFSGETIEQI
jgi:hypothetical protein